MKAEVIIPWRDTGDPDRSAALGWVLDRWAEMALPLDVTIAQTSGPGPWVKAEAVNPAVGISGADIVIIADADVWCEAVPDALVAVQRGAPWAIPHGKVHRLTAASTAAVLAGTHPARLGPGATSETPYIGVASGGLVVLAREIALDVPLDRRFRNWGGEDHAWGFALQTLHGEPWRSSAPLWHLWHEPEPRINRRVGNQASEALRRRYAAARGHRPSMRAIIEEAIHAVDPCEGRTEHRRRA